MQKNVKWLEGVLNANGFTPADLAQQTGLPLDQINQLIANQPVNEDVWDIILSTINEYPALDYPSSQILEDIQNDINDQGEDGPVIVFYGVSADDMIFVGYQLLSNMEYRGAQVSQKYLSQLNLTLGQIQELFTKQNCLLKD